jgi:nucleoside 2-deoxyribosyltransferase
MSFSEELSNAWLEGFKPGVEAGGYFTAVRVDQVQHNDKIDDRIVAEIRRSGLVVADFTGQRGGVYFEAGYALGLGIPVIWTCRNDDVSDLHFDTRQYNHLVWEKPADLKLKLANRIAATVLPVGRSVE